MTDVSRSDVFQLLHSLVFAPTEMRPQIVAYQSLPAWGKWIGSGCRG